MKKLFFVILGLICISTAVAGIDEILWNNPNGSSCVTDYECGSLCCDSTNTCKDHDPKEGVLCNKSPGEKCITTDFCNAEYVITCRIYKLGINSNGSMGCVMRCNPVLTKGDCRNGYCQAPTSPPVPSWDGVDCSNAIDP